VVVPHYGSLKKFLGLRGRAAVSSVGNDTAAAHLFKTMRQIHTNALN